MRSVNTANTTYDVLVVDGRRTGARASLLDNDKTSVGTSLDCDIVLASASGDLMHSRVDIFFQDDGWRCEVIEGSVGVNDEQAHAGDSFGVTTETRIALGESVFALVSNQVEPRESVDSENRSKVTSTRNRFSTLGLTAFVGVCFVIAGIASYMRMGNNAQGVLSHQTDLQSILNASPYSGVELMTLEDGTQIVVGRVETRKEHIQLKSLLNQAGYRQALDVSIDETFIDDVAAVYRLNGVDAEIDLTAPGEVSVTTMIADERFLDDVEFRAYQDVPDLVALHRVNTPPPVMEPEPEPNFTELPGKRIKMVVTTDPAFILTEDGSRYFTGAILPSGHKIKAIFEKTVQLERDNEVVDLLF